MPPAGNLSSLWDPVPSAGLRECASTDGRTHEVDGSSVESVREVFCPQEWHVLTNKNAGGCEYWPPCSEKTAVFPARSQDLCSLCIVQTEGTQSSSVRCVRALFCRTLFSLAVIVRDPGGKRSLLLQVVL